MTFLFNTATWNFNLFFTKFIELFVRLFASLPKNEIFADLFSHVTSLENEKAPFFSPKKQRNNVKMKVFEKFEFENKKIQNENNPMTSR